MPKFVFFEYLHFTWNSHFGIWNFKLGKIWPRRFNWLDKTKLEPKFEVSISKNKKTGQQCSYQKIWKILLLDLRTLDILICTQNLKKILHLKFGAYQNVQTLASSPCVKAARGSKNFFTRKSRYLWILYSWLRLYIVLFFLLYLTG